MQPGAPGTGPADHDRHVAAQLARDYLGPHALATLVKTPEAGRALAFAQEWTAHEAHLKYLGLALSEWTALPAMRSIAATAVSPDCVATVALNFA